VLKALLEDAKSQKIETETIQRKNGIETGTLDSCMVKLTGFNAHRFAKSWTGTILWIGQSPFRRFHKRKNWFVGVHPVPKENQILWDENDFSFQTLRASGPGGQHVNKTESAVRAIHNPSRISVTASDSRSQLQNKKLAIDRLKNKMAQWQMNELSKNEQSNWQQHNTLERGNPTRVFKGAEFVYFESQSLCLLC